jgi:predicted dehydrogenase/NADPH:quinone reductase-like Zn-dependent oxidoreductase
MGDRLMELLRRRLERRLAARGYSAEATADGVRSVRWWADARLAAARRRRRVLAGSTLLAVAPGRVELVPCEVPLAGRGELTVEIAASIVSPGTERAQYLRLPNAQIEFPYRPGYSTSGRVVAVGRNVRDFSPGDLVAVPRVPHSSVATVPAASAYRIPDGVRAEDAAFVYLGMISGFGVWQASLDPGADLAVVGCGPIGALAQRLAMQLGVGNATMIATSGRRERVARAGGAELLLAGERERLEGLELPVVIDATGAPEGFAVAVAAARERGRIVLLGSPRGVSDVPLQQVRRKRLTIVGAHISALATVARRTGTDPFEELAETFLQALAAGTLRVDDLAEVVADPREATAFYRRLATDSSLVGARFDWSLLPGEQRARRAKFVSRPSLDRDGLEPDGSPLVVPARRALPDRRLDAAAALRVGLLGCGEIGAQNARAIAAARNAELVASFDPDARLAGDVADRFGGAACTSPEQLFESGLDAAFVATPHHLHAPLALQAIESGLHVMVEKPLARNTQEAGSMAAAARAAGVLLSVCFPYRYEAHIEAAKHFVGEGALGDAAGALVSYAADKPPSYWLGGYSGRSIGGWRASREKAGGGVLIMNLCHYLDLVRYIAGLEAEAVSASVEQPDREDAVEGSIAVAVRYANGGVGSLFGCSALRGAAFSELRVWGDAGQLELEPRPRLYTLRAVEGVRAGRWHALPEPGPEDVRTTYVERFAEAVRDSRTPDITAEDGLAVQALMDAAYDSAETGEMVRPADLLAQVRS